MLCTSGRYVSQGLAFGVRDSGYTYEVQGNRTMFGVYSTRLRVDELGVRGFGFWVLGSGVWGLGFGVCSLKCRVWGWEKRVYIARLGIDAAIVPDAALQVAAVPTAGRLLMGRC